MRKNVMLRVTAEIPMRALAALATLGLVGCGAASNTSYLTNPLTMGQDSIQCTVTVGKTTKAGFDEMCGKAPRSFRTRGCDGYTTDQGRSMFYCFEGGKLVRFTNDPTR